MNSTEPKNVIHVLRVRPSVTSPLLSLVDDSMGRPDDWVRGLAAPTSIVRARISRPPERREFCNLAPGVLALRERDLEGESGTTSMHYALRWETLQVDLDVGGIAYVCFIPKLTLGPDARSDAPCPIDGVYASVFRISGRPASETYCTSGVVQGGDELPHLYQSEGYKGLQFESLWCGRR